MRVALVQLTATADPTLNLRCAQAAIDRAASSWSPDLIALPEMWPLIGGEDAARREVAGSGEALALLRGEAARRSVWIHAGSILEPSPCGRALNVTYLIDPSGAPRGRYVKAHLFDVDLPSGRRLRESDRFAPGETLARERVEIAGEVWRLGQSICYDLRFPELYQALGGHGVDAFFAPSAFTHETGAAHFEVLVRARAIETAAWMIAPNQCGSHDPAGGRRSWGRSMVVDPWGCVRLQMDERPGVAAIDIDLDAVRRARGAIPIWEHKRRPSPTLSLAREAGRESRGLGA